MGPHFEGSTSRLGSWSARDRRRSIVFSLMDSSPNLPFLLFQLDVLYSSQIFAGFVFFTVLLLIQGKTNVFTPRSLLMEQNT